MDKDYIYVKLMSSNNVCINKIQFVLKDVYNNIVFNGITDNYGGIELPINNKNIYKLLIYSGVGLIQIPIYALKNARYCICINEEKNNKKKNNKMLLFDSNYPEIQIKKGEIILWQ